MLSKCVLFAALVATATANIPPTVFVGKGASCSVYWSNCQQGLVCVTRKQRKGMVGSNDKPGRCMKGTVAYQDGQPCDVKKGLFCASGSKCAGPKGKARRKGICQRSKKNVPMIVVGRPFSTEDGPLLAPLSPLDPHCDAAQADNTWGGSQATAASDASFTLSADATPDTASLSDSQRASLAEVWQKQAQGEHASVASFSRFSLQLMSVAAPPHLLTGAHNAALDEIRHAQLSFQMAHAYAQTAEQSFPGAFPIQADHSVYGDLAHIAESVVEEGCVGETIAALLGAVEADAATDEVAKQVLTSIAHDEATHAALAWQTVRWALSVGDSTVRTAVEQAFERALAVEEAKAVSLAEVMETGVELVQSQGKLSVAGTERLRAYFLSSVVAQTAQELLGNEVAPGVAANATRTEAQLDDFSELAWAKANIQNVFGSTLSANAL